MILIVEDDDVARGAMRRLLAASGYENVAVQSAEEAVAVLNSGSHLDAAFIDWDLPGTMSGLDLIRHVRDTLPGTPAVLVTGAARERVEDAARRFGISYMRKPVDFRNLLKMLPPELKKVSEPKPN